METVDLLFASGQKNMSGIKTIAYYANFDDIETHPQLVNPAVTIKDLVLLTGEFVMKSGKYFHKLYTTLEKGKIDSKRIGGVDHGCFVSEAELFYPKEDENSLGLAAFMVNSQCVLIIVEPSTGYKRVFGNDYFSGAHTEMSDGSSGDAAGTDKGVHFKFKSIGNEPAPIYGGSIPLLVPES